MWRQDIDMTMASQSSFINWLHNITYESGAPPYRKWAHDFLFNYCIDSKDEMHSLQGFAIILYIYSSSICHRKLFHWLRCGRVFNNATPLQPMFFWNNKCNNSRPADAMGWLMVPHSRSTDTVLSCFSSMYKHTNNRKFDNRIVLLLIQIKHSYLYL